MKIDLNKPLLDLDGKSLLEGDKPETLRGACVNCLLASLVPQDQGELGKDKLERAKLAEKVHVGGIQDLSIDELALIKKRAEMVFVPLWLLKVSEALEGK